MAPQLPNQMSRTLSGENPRVRKIRVRNSGAGNGCANFMDIWKNAFFLQENLHVHKIPRFGGGGGILGLGGGSADFIFMGARIFLTLGGALNHYILNQASQNGIF